HLEARGVGLRGHEHPPALLHAEVAVVGLEGGEGGRADPEQPTGEHEQAIFERGLVHLEEDRPEAGPPALQLGGHRRVGPGRAVEPADGRGDGAADHREHVEGDEGGAQLRPGAG
ncbi:MAG: hypothetical protein ACK559_25355, partial [bacterium]